jgi:hypothetical protein
VLSCYATDPVEDLPELMFLPEQHQISPAEVGEALMAAGSGGD